MFECGKLKVVSSYVNPLMTTFASVCSNSLNKKVSAFPLKLDTSFLLLKFFGMSLGLV